MSNEASEANATASESVAKPEPKALSLQDFVEMQNQQAEAQGEAKETKERETTETEAEETQEQTQETQDEVQDTEESQETQEETPEEQSTEESEERNWDDLSDEEISELAQKGKSRLLKRIADLTAKRKLAEQKSQQLEQERQALLQQAQDPLKKREESADNPYKDVTDVNALAEKAKEVDTLIEATEDILFQNEHAAADEVVYTENGTDYTKAQIRKTLREAQRARKNHLPAQLQNIQAQQQRARLRSQLTQEAQNALSWTKDKDNDTLKQYEALMSGPVVKEIMEKVPNAAPYMDMLMMHATNSLFAPKSVPKKAVIKPEPPSNTSGSAASGNLETSVSKQIKEIEKRGKESGLTMDDFTKLAVLRDKLAKQSR